MVKEKGRLKMFAGFVEVPIELVEIFSEKAKNNKLNFGSDYKNTTQEIIDFEHKFFKRFLIASYDSYKSNTVESTFVWYELVEWVFEQYFSDYSISGRFCLLSYMDKLYVTCLANSSTAYSIVKEEDIESLREELGIKEDVVEEVIYTERKRTIPEKILIKLLRVVDKSSK